MIVGSNITTLMQQVMAMKSPELVAILPEIEKIDFEARVALVRRGHENLSSVIKNWDKFAEILAAQRDLSKSEIKGQAKRLKNVRSKRSEEQTSELQSIMRISSAVFCLKKK